MMPIEFHYLAERPDLPGLLTHWFESEWPAYYCAGGPGNALQDLRAYSNRDTLPLGLVAFQDRVPCGFAVLKREPFPSHPQLFPWVGAAFVLPQRRRQGIGGLLVHALEREALRLGHGKVYCATRTAASLLIRAGWQRLASVIHEGQPIEIYDKTL